MGGGKEGGGPRQQQEGERELAARSAPAQKGERAVREPADPRQAIDRSPAWPGRRRRKLRRPRQRLAAETDPNRVDRSVKLCFLHLWPPRGKKTQGRSGGERTISNRRSGVKGLHRGWLSFLYVEGRRRRRRGDRLRHRRAFELRSTPGHPVPAR